MVGNSEITCKAALVVRIANELIEQPCRNSIRFAGSGRVTGEPTPTLFSAFPGSLAGSGQGWEGSVTR